MNKTGLVICNTRGETIDVSLCSEKSRFKTVEQGELWVVDPTTGRVLPYRGGGAVLQDGFVQREGWYEVVLTFVPPPPAKRAPGETAGEGAATDEEVRGGGPGLGGEEQAHRIGRTLSHLTEVIAERHRTMPEGSYTTHLFSKGGAKIRKKTGEEAVELILAADTDELTSEAADLLYHLMVLLEAESLSIDDVIDVLAERF